MGVWYIIVSIGDIKFSKLNSQFTNQKYTKY